MVACLSSQCEVLSSNSSTHTHTHRERERERDDLEGRNPGWLLAWAWSHPSLELPAEHLSRGLLTPIASYLCLYFFPCCFSVSYTQWSKMILSKHVADHIIPKFNILQYFPQRKVKVLAGPGGSYLQSQHSGGWDSDTGIWQIRGQSCLHSEFKATLYYIARFCL
jgi:hypothetical protein